MCFTQLCVGCVLLFVQNFVVNVSYSFVDGPLLPVPVGAVLVVSMDLPHEAGDKNRMVAVKSEMYFCYICYSLYGVKNSSWKSNFKGCS